MSLIESMIPAGEHVKLSGTSMASPQVANLAAKLIAPKPDGLSTCLWVAAKR